MKKINGFSQPKPCEMKLAVCIGLILITIYFVIVIPILAPVNQIITSLIYTFLSLSTIFFAFCSAYIDPSDKQLKYDSVKFCTICKKSVSSSAKHCGQCNRCVSQFDHHCIWVNNCIGELNYKHFALTIFFLELFMAYQLCTSILILVWTVQKNSEIKDLFSTELILAFMAISIAVSAFCFISNGVLIVFHIYLFFKKLTTYEFIVQHRKRQNKVAAEDDLPKFYEPYVDNSRSESFELVRAPNLLSTPNI